MKNNFRQRIFLLLVLILGGLVLCSGANAGPSVPNPPIDIGIVSPTGVQQLLESSDFAHYPDLELNPATGQMCAAYSVETGPNAYDIYYACLEQYPDRVTKQLVAEGVPANDSIKVSLDYDPVTLKPGIGFYAVTSTGGPEEYDFYIIYAFYDPTMGWDDDLVENFTASFFYDTRVSLAHKSDGTPCMAYYQGIGGTGTANLKYACFQGNGEGSWTQELVETGVANGSDLDLRFDSSDTPFISFQDTGGDFAGKDTEQLVASFTYAYPGPMVAYKDSSIWHKVDLDPLAPGEILQLYSDMEIIDDAVCMSYVVRVGATEPAAYDSDEVVAQFFVPTNYELRANCLVGGEPNPPQTIDVVEAPDYISYNDLEFYWLEGQPMPSAFIFYEKGGVTSINLAWYMGDWATTNLGMPGNNGLDAELKGDYFWLAYEQPGASLYVERPDNLFPWSWPGMSQLDYNSMYYGLHVAFDDITDGGEGWAVYVVNTGEKSCLVSRIIYPGSGSYAWNVQCDEDYPYVSALDTAWEHLAKREEGGFIRPHISYLHTPDVYYGYYDSDPENFVLEDTGIDYSYDNIDTAIALDSENNPCIVYPGVYGSAPALYYTCRTNSWTAPEFIDYISGGLSSFSLAFKGDTPYVSYSNNSDEFVIAKNEGSGWEEVFSYSWGRSCGRSSDLDFDSGGRLMAAFQCEGYMGAGTYVTSNGAPYNWGIGPVFYSPLEGLGFYTSEIQLEFGSTPHIMARGDGEVAHARLTGDFWQWEKVNPVEMSYGTSTYSFGLRGGVPHALVVIPGSPNFLDHTFLQDADGDGRNDEFDDYIGPGLISGYPVRIENHPNVFGQISEAWPINVSFGPVSFQWNFDGWPLNLSGASVNKRPGMIEVHGIYTPIPGGKTVVLDNNGATEVCILDAPGASTVYMSADCSDANEFIVPCPGTNGDYECLAVDGNFIVSGLHYSAVRAGLLEEEDEGGDTACAVMGGVICAENEACDTGFVRAADTERCCQGTCVSAADLAVSDVSVPEALIFTDTSTTVTVTVENLGSVDANSFNVSLTVKETGDVVGQKTVDFLAAGTSTDLTFNFNPAGYDGLLTLEAKADALNAITEADEENNIALLEVYVRDREELPEEEEDFVDLLVLNVELSNPNTIVGEDIEVTAEILNAGTKAAGAFTAGVYADSVYEPVLDEELVSGLEPLDSVEVSFNFSTLELPEQSEIIVFADDGRTVVEIDEENNTSSKPLSLMGEIMSVLYTKAAMVDDQYVLTVTDEQGNPLPGVTIKINYPFEGAIKTETLVSDSTGKVWFPIGTAGMHSFSAIKPGYYPVYGEFTAEGEGVLEPEPSPFVPVDFDFNNIIIVIVAVIIIAGIAYTIVIRRKK